jgi:hypothetical protein
MESESLSREKDNQNSKNLLDLQKMLQEKDDELSDIRQTSERYYSEYQVSSKDLD